VLGDGSRLSVAKLLDREEPLFAGVDLLALSACNTAIGDDDEEGREVDSMAKVAELLGARSVLASLWPVADASTALLMGEFYRLLKEEPHLTKPEALHRAQKWIQTHSRMSGSTPQPITPLQTKRGSEVVLPAGAALGFQVSEETPYAHPYYWAPFIMLGESW
jgi:CHAT domain-containing protein